MFKIKYLVGAFAFAVCVAGFLWLSGKSQAVAEPWLTPDQITKLDVEVGSDTGEVAFVSRVVDGDTIVARTFDPATGEPARQEKVRYIGMDTPETVKPNTPVACYGHEASARNKALVEGRYIVMQKDVTDRDKYGRLLRFIYILDESSGTVSPIITTFVDLELVKEGYARVLTIPPNTEYEAEFKAASAAARAAKLGFWGACAQYPFTSP